MFLILGLPIEECEATFNLVRVSSMSLVKY